MLDEEGRTRLKLKVCVCVREHIFSCDFCSSVCPNADCPVSCHRWKIQFDGEPKGTRKETKRERATRALSSGLMAGVRWQCDVPVCTL